MAKNRGKLIQLPRESIHSPGEDWEGGLTTDRMKLGGREFIKHIGLLLLGYTNGGFPKWKSQIVCKRRKLLLEGENLARHQRTRCADLLFFDDVGVFELGAIHLCSFTIPYFST